MSELNDVHVLKYSHYWKDYISYMYIRYDGVRSDPVQGYDLVP